MQFISTSTDADAAFTINQSMFHLSTVDETIFINLCLHFVKFWNIIFYEWMFFEEKKKTILLNICQVFFYFSLKHKSKLASISLIKKKSQKLFNLKLDENELWCQNIFPLIFNCNFRSKWTTKLIFSLLNFVDNNISIAQINIGYLLFENLSIFIPLVKLKCA